MPKKGNSWYFAVPPLLNLFIQALLLMPLKTQYDQRAKRFLFLYESISNRVFISIKYRVHSHLTGTIWEQGG